jgi:hypothetical protein
MSVKIYNQKSEKKFISSIDLSDYQILTDGGFVDLVSLHQTIPYRVWEIKTHNGFELECADDHIVFNENGDEVFVKDLGVGDRIQTQGGIGIVVSNRETDRIENMWDFELIEGSDRRYWTNGILSHNTELAKQIANYLFESEDSMIRVDMSEYMEKFSINRVIGSPSGYVGYEDSNLLDQIRRKPYSVILMDEVEKAHPDVYNLFLQAFDDGHMTDSHGRRVSFKNCIILMTSNVGTKTLKDFGTGIGFSNKKGDVENKSHQVKMVLEKELKKKFSPEFINRIEEIIYFNDLSREDIEKILKIELGKTLMRLEGLGFSAQLDDTIIDKLVEVGYDPQYGARPMKRAIQRWIDDPLIDVLLGNPKQGTQFKISYDSNSDSTKVDEVIEKKPRKKKNDDPTEE